MAGRNRSHCFSVTINHVEWTKDCLAEFLTASGDIKRLAIGEEVHHPPLDCVTGELVPGDHGFHHHIFVEFKERYFLTEVRAIFEEFLGQEPWSFDVQVSYTIFLICFNISI